MHRTVPFLMLILSALTELTSQSNYQVIRSHSLFSEHLTIRTQKPTGHTKQEMALTINEAMGIDAEWEFINSYVDPYEIEHHRFQQKEKGYSVLGKQMIVHIKNKIIFEISGKVLIDKVILPTALKTADEAFQMAQKYAGIPNRKNINLRKDQTQAPELVIINRNYPNEGGEYRLSWKVHIHEEVPHDLRKIFVDAENGELLLNMDLMMNCGGEKGKMHTLFHGVQDVETEKDGEVFITKDFSRGDGIVVRSVRGNYFQDDDNVWVEGHRDHINGAYDLFWGLQSTFDYFLNRFSRKGIDDKNIITQAILLDTGIYNNAFWDSNLKTLNFGLGNGTSVKPFTSVDIVAHEYAHGVTQFTAGLEYLYESGALNESFSDIFGKAVEHEYDGANFNWLLGNKIYANPNQAIRSMEDPNRFNNPKYYRGRFWVGGSSDNGGVHSNSGILNHWYFLLSEGGEGINEGNRSFKVRKMGIDTATLIAYHLLRDYLTPTSNYADARFSCLQMLASWWGLCSEQYLNVAEAWKAVGIGTNPLEGDVQLVTERTLFTVCRDGLVQLPSIVINHSCNQTLAKGTKFIARYQMDNLNPVEEEIMIDRDILPGEFFSFNFNKLPIITRQGSVRFTVQLQDYWDSDTSNNQYVFFLNRNINLTEHDFQIQRLTVTGNSCPGGTEGYRASLVAIYNGCTTVPKGSSFVLSLKMEDSLAHYPFVNERSVFPGATMRPPAFIIPRAFLGIKKVEANLIWSPDTTLDNNQSNFQIVYTDFTYKEEVETFTNASFNIEKIQVYSDSFSNYQIQTLNELNSEAFVVFGNGIFTESGALRIRSNTDASSFLDSNVPFVTSIFLCTNTQGLVQPILEFDLYQKLGELQLSTYGPSNEFGSICRVIYRNNRGQTMHSELFMLSPNQLSKLDKIRSNLPDSSSLIEIQMLCLHSKKDGDGNLDIEKSDLIAVDNIVIVEGSTSNKDVNLQENILVSPVPVQDVLSLWIGSDEVSIKECRIFDQNGKLMQIFRLEQKSNPVSILVGTYPAGVYQIKYFNNDGSSRSIRFVKI
ncbi:MAG: M4 family metallopeptidase [Saprospiraceae bacterium]|nr:M4 family metallopeptidase [Saprospiraceae bacterium]